ncbi:hypothetical protein ACQVPW_11355 [Bacillus cereus]|uniref:hypothetical protein n=1 Tax=Bacillus cereus TaxID=1396 RepID=UPI003D649CF0
MTLIAGIVLPNGILIMSDTLVMENGENIYTEYGLKINRVTPTTLIGTSGTEYLFYFILALKQALYDNVVHTTQSDIRAIILSKYKMIHEDFLTKDDLRIFGHFLVAEYDQTSETYTLISNSNENPRHFYEKRECSKFKNVEVIGAIWPLANYVKSHISEKLETYAPNIIEDPLFHKNFSRECNKIFKAYSNEYPQYNFNDKLYCVYLTTQNKQPHVEDYLWDDGNYFEVDTHLDKIYRK